MHVINISGMYFVYMLCIKYVPDTLYYHIVTQIIKYLIQSCRHTNHHILYTLTSLYKSSNTLYNHVAIQIIKYLIQSCRYTNHQILYTIMSLYKLSNTLYNHVALKIIKYFIQYHYNVSGLYICHKYISDMYTLFM